MKHYKGVWVAAAAATFLAACAASGPQTIDAGNCAALKGTQLGQRLDKGHVFGHGCLDELQKFLERHFDRNGFESHRGVTRQRIRWRHGRC